ncbi:MAG: oligosaccharide flippase family protein [Hyphomonadaceae bacterium]
MTEHAPEAAPEAAPRADRKGAALASLSRVWAQASGGVLLLVASAVLTPTVFGEYVLAMSFFALLQLFAGSGVYEYVLRERESKAAPMTAIILNMCTSGAALGVMMLASLFADRLFHSTHIGDLMRLLAPAMLLQGANLVLETVLLRRAQVTRVSVVMIVSDGLGMALAVAGLHFGGGAAALVLQKLGREGALLIGYAACAGVSRPIGPDFGEAVRMARFATGIIGTRLLGQGANTSLDMLIGAILNPAAAGLFRLANRLIGMAFDILHFPMRTMMWVTLPPLRHDPAAFSQTLLRMAATYSVLLCACIAGIGVIAPTAFPLLFKPEWQPVVPIIAIMAAARLLVWPGSLMEQLLAIRNDIRLLIGWEIMNFTLGVGMLAIFAHYGLTAAAVSQLAAAFISQLVTLPLIAKKAPLPYLGLLSLVGRLWGLVFLMTGAVLAWLALANSLAVNAWLTLALGVLIGAAVYAGAAARIVPEGMEAYFSAARAIFAKARGALRAAS